MPAFTAAVGKHLFSYSLILPKLYAIFDLKPLNILMASDIGYFANGRIQ